MVALGRATINTGRLQVPLRQDYGTKVNLFSHLHQYSRKKPLTQQMRYVASPAQAPVVTGSALAGLAGNGRIEGMSWSCMWGGVVGDLSTRAEEQGQPVPGL